jgi:hypothetical protein
MSCALRVYRAANAVSAARQGASLRKSRADGGPEINLDVYHPESTRPRLDTLDAVYSDV